jgi:predicted nucleotidyltransferase
MQTELTKREAIKEIARRLIEYYRPLRIYLFGSKVRGDAGPDRDLDFCVVLPDDAPRSLYGPGVLLL